MASQRRHRFAGRVTTHGVGWDNLPRAEFMRRQNYFVAPCHAPTWYVSDTSFGSRGVNWRYEIPPRRLNVVSDLFSESYDPQSWSTASDIHQRHLVPPSGFPNLSVRAHSADAAGSATIQITMVDCLLRVIEETFQIEFLGTGAAETIFSLVGCREVLSVKVLKAATNAAGVLFSTSGEVVTLEIGHHLDALNATENVPEEQANWRLGFPMPLRRRDIARLGLSPENAANGYKTINVDGYIFGSVNALPQVAAQVNNPMHLGGGFGTAGGGMPSFEDGTFDAVFNTWLPPAGARPLCAGGDNAGENVTQFRFYRFSLNERRKIPNLPV